MVELNNWPRNKVLLVIATTAGIGFLISCLLSVYCSVSNYPMFFDFGDPWVNSDLEASTATYERFGLRSTLVAYWYSPFHNPNDWPGEPDIDADPVADNLGRIIRQDYVGWPLPMFKCTAVGWQALVPAVSSRNKEVGAVYMDTLNGCALEASRGMNNCVTHIDGAIAVRHDDGRVTLLPIIPIWKGVLVNSVFYAAMLVLIWHVTKWSKYKWRTWHGACQSCGYDLRGLDGGRCPECGKGRPNDSLTTPQPTAKPLQIPQAHTSDTHPQSESPQ